jgi:hypothetical protein
MKTLDDTLCDPDHASAPSAPIVLNREDVSAHQPEPVAPPDDDDDEDEDDDDRGSSGGNIDPDDDEGDFDDDEDDEDETLWTAAPVP